MDEGEIIQHHEFREIRQMMMMTGNGWKIRVNPFASTSKIHPNPSLLEWRAFGEIKLNYNFHISKKKGNFLQIMSDTFDCGSEGNYDLFFLMKNIELILHVPMMLLASAPADGKFKFIASKRIYFLKDSCNKCFFSRSDKTQHNI